MNCCTPAETIALQEVADEPKVEIRARCSKCAGASRYVTRKTMLLMLKNEFFEQISDGQYYFCANPDCKIVYFPEAQGTTFYTNHLRIRVGTKEKEDPKPLCYCFGFDVSDFRDEINREGQTKILGRIAELLKAGMCACETRNPSGACCLGDITKTVKQLQVDLTRTR